MENSKARKVIEESIVGDWLSSEQKEALNLALLALGKEKEYQNKLEQLMQPEHIETFMYELSVNDRGEIPVLIKVHDVDHTMAITEKDARGLAHIFKIHNMIGGTS